MNPKALWPALGMLALAILWGCQTSKPVTRNNPGTVLRPGLIEAKPTDKWPPRLLALTKHVEPPVPPVVVEPKIPSALMAFFAVSIPQATSNQIAQLAACSGTNGITDWSRSNIQALTMARCYHEGQHLTFTIVPAPGLPVSWQGQVLQASTNGAEWYDVTNWSGATLTLARSNFASGVMFRNRALQ